MATIQQLAKTFQTRFADLYDSCTVDKNEVTVELPKENLLEICLALRDEEPFIFDMLIDACGVDFSCYGISEWETKKTTLTGFERAVDKTCEQRVYAWDKPRFAVVYHLLSISHNHRIRLRVFLDDEPPMIDSIVDIWNSANWFEREAFDMFGILFKGHPDLRRILTDYGFVGHPFRKDFPLIGHVEMRYDRNLGRCVYEPVSVQSRTLVPKVIRHDNRYHDLNEEQKDG